MRRSLAITGMLASCLHASPALADAGVIAPSVFYLDCLKSGGTPAVVGTGSLTMPIYNGRVNATARAPLRFQITVAPSDNVDASAAFDREPTPNGDTASFAIAQGHAAYVTAHRLTWRATFGSGRLELCIRQF